VACGPPHPALRSWRPPAACGGAAWRPQASARWHPADTALIDWLARFTASQMVYVSLTDTCHSPRLQLPRCPPCPPCCPPAVVHIKPFGCFVEFAAQMPDGQQAPLMGLVHRSEVSWDAATDIMQAVQVRAAPCCLTCFCFTCQCRCQAGDGLPPVLPATAPDLPWAAHPPPAAGGAACVCKGAAR
jgi:hypothetical protein